MRDRLAPWTGERRTLLTFDEQDPGLRSSFPPDVADRLARIGAAYDPDARLLGEPRPRLSPSAPEDRGAPLRRTVVDALEVAAAARERVRDGRRDRVVADRPVEPGRRPDVVDADGARGGGVVVAPGSGDLAQAVAVVRGAGPDEGAVRHAGEAAQHAGGLLAVLRRGGLDRLADRRGARRERVADAHDAVPQPERGAGAGRGIAVAGAHGGAEHEARGHHDGYAVRSKRIASSVPPSAPGRIAYCDVSWAMMESPKPAPGLSGRGSIPRPESRT